MAVLTGAHVRVSEDGRLHADTPEAGALIEILGLHLEEAVEFRMTWIGIIALAAENDPDLYRRLMGYPNDLPNLASLRPPDGNSRPEGIQQSSFAARQNGTLPETYWSACNPVQMCYSQRVPAGDRCRNRHNPAGTVRRQSAAESPRSVG